MAMPKKLKNFNVFSDGESFLGQVKSITLPTLTRKMEDWRGGGMSGPVKTDLGQEALEIKATYGGAMHQVMKQYGLTTHDGAGLRFAGAYQRDDTGAVDAVEVIVRGRHSEMELGDAEAGEDSEFAVTTACSYFKYVVNGQTLIEIDMVNMIEIVGGVDRMAQQKRAIGA